MCEITLNKLFYFVYIFNFFKCWYEVIINEVQNIIKIKIHTYLYLVVSKIPLVVIVTEIKLYFKYYEHDCFKISTIN